MVLAEAVGIGFEGARVDGREPSVDVKQFRMILGLVLTAAVVVIGAAAIYLKSSAAEAMSLNEWGDFLAGVSAPLALLWLVIGYFPARKGVTAQYRSASDATEGTSATSSERLRTLWRPLIGKLWQRNRIFRIAKHVKAGRLSPNSYPGQGAFQVDKSYRTVAERYAMYRSTVTARMNSIFLRCRL